MSARTSINVVQVEPHDEHKKRRGWDEDVDNSTLSSISDTDITESLRNSGNSNNIFLSSKKIIEPLRQSGRDWNLKSYTLESLRLRSNRLYGREDQVVQLKQIFRDSCKHQNKKHLVVLEGSAGVGKSALALQLLPITKIAAGFYLVGKFDLQVPVEPYAVWTGVVRDLTNSLLAHQLNPQARNNKWQFSYDDIVHDLHKELSEEGLVEVLTSVFPDLVPILGGTYLYQTSSAATTEHYKEAKNRLNYAFRRLVRVLAEFGPLVIIMDDLQWSDVASLEMLQVLLADPDLKGVMVVACIRPEEITETHPFAKMRKDLMEAHTLPAEKPGGKDNNASETSASATEPISNSTMDRQQAASPPSLVVTQLNIGSLSLESLHSMLQDFLSIPNNSTKGMALTECIFRKTAGNAFFVIQFLQLLVVDNLLTHNVGSMEWTWDLDLINQSQASTLNVVQMVQAKMTCLSPEIQKLLPVVASLGATCEYTIFEKAIQYFPNDFSSRETSTSESSSSDILHQHSPQEVLQICQDAGLLTPHTSNTVHWEHDKLQEAALKLITDVELSMLRFKLGSFLFDELEPKDLESNIFLVANLLDGSPARLNSNDNQRRLALAELNLAAGKTAMNALASVSASPFLSRGIELLPDQHWQTNYQLSLDLYSTAAEAYYSAGDFVTAEDYCNQVFAQGKEEHNQQPFLDMQRCHHVVMGSRFAQGGTLDARDECLGLLAKLGCKFPKQGRIFYTIAGILKIKSSVKNTKRQILGLQTATNPLHVWTMKLIDTLCSYTYNNSPDLFALAILKGFQYTLKFGVSDFSPSIISIIGLILGSMDDLQGAKIYSEVALDLFERFEISKQAYARTLFVTSSMALHYQVPADQIQKYMIKAYQEGMAIGDTENAMWSIYNYLEVAFHTGTPLQEIGKDCQEYSSQMRDLKQVQALISTQGLHQVVINLTKPTGLHILSGSLFDWRDYERVENFKGRYDRVRIFLAFWAGDYQETMRILHDSGAMKGAIEKKHPGLFGLYAFNMHGAVTCFHEFRRTKKRKCRRMAQRFANKLRLWARKGCPNCQHTAVLIQAEDLAVRGKFTRAIKAYKDAILLAGRQGFINDQALANERLGDYYWSLEFYEEALFHIENATRLYGEWGNQQKVKMMQALYPRNGLPPKDITITPGAMNISTAYFQSTDCLSLAT